MTDQNPLDDFDPSLIQTVEVTNPDLAALFTEDGRVFYNLDSLVAQFSLLLMPRILDARATGDEVEMGRCQGAAFVIESIKASALDLRERYDLEKSFALPDAPDPHDS